MAVMSEKLRSPLHRTEDVVANEVDVDVDAERSDHPIVLAHDRYGRALEASGTDVELIIELVLFLAHAAHQVDQQGGRAHFESAPGHFSTFNSADRPGGIGEIVHQDFDAHVRKGPS